MFLYLILLCNPTQVKHIVLIKGTELLRVPIDRLMYISSDGNYSNVVTQDGRSRLIGLQLGQIEDILNAQFGNSYSNIVRLGRGHIINTDYIYFIDVAKQKLILSDCQGSLHELSISKDGLRSLMGYFEELINNKNGSKD